MKTETKSNKMAQLTFLFGMMVSGVVVLPDEQVDSILQMLSSAFTSSSGVLPVSAPPVKTDAPDIIAGYDALSDFLGYSVPTCMKLSKEGRFDKAVINYGGGTRKKMWDRRKLLEIGHSRK